MAGWESLRVDLRRLLEEPPGALVAFPDRDSERHERLSLGGPRPGVRRPTWTVAASHRAKDRQRQRG